MTRRISKIWCALFLVSVVAGCAGPEEDEDGALGELALETTCEPVYSRFPIDGAHNLGYDTTSCAPTLCNFYCPPQAQAVANDGFHDGEAQDIFAARGTQVVAAQTGTTVREFTNSAGGNVVFIQDDCGWVHYYAHLDTIDPGVFNGGVVGVRVTAGTRIGTVGNTGNASGTSHHLHYATYSPQTGGRNPYAGLTSVEWYSCTANFADLGATAITKNVATVTTGSVVTFDSGVINSGPTGTGGFSVKWFIDGVQVGYGGHAGVPANTTVMGGNSAFTWTATPGTHAIRFLVDADNAVPERFEGNNLQELTITVTDLADLTPTPITKNLVTIYAGNTVSFDSGVTNSGSVGTGSFAVKWFVDGVQVGHGGHTGVPANSTVPNGNSAFLWTATAGTHTISFVLDTGNAVAERNESNNTAQLTVSVSSAGPAFSGLSATLACTSRVNFAYSGSSPSYSVDLSLTADFSTGVWQTFGSGSGSPISVTNPQKWTSYTSGRTLYYRIWNADRSVRSAIGAATVTCANPTFSGLSATLGCTSSFAFTYNANGSGAPYAVDLSLTADMSSGVYLTFGSGNGSPIVVSSPKTRWTSYTHGRTLYYRVWNTGRTIGSVIRAATVNCP